jgi:hypothetical protein
MGKYNKLGIKIYRGSRRFVDGIRFTVDSINVDRPKNGINQYYRIIDFNKFGIDILCYKVYKK